MSTDRHILSAPWVRILLFLWGVVFPLVFIVIPTAEYFSGESPFPVAALWATAVWMLSPMMASIAMKYFGPRKTGAADTNK